MVMCKWIKEEKPRHLVEKICEQYIYIYFTQGNWMPFTLCSVSFQVWSTASQKVIKNFPEEVKHIHILLRL